MCFPRCLRLSGSFFLFVQGLRLLIFVFCCLGFGRGTAVFVHFFVYSCFHTTTGHMHLCKRTRVIIARIQIFLGRQFLLASAETHKGSTESCRLCRFRVGLGNNARDACGSHTTPTNDSPPNLLSMCFYLHIYGCVPFVTIAFLKVTLLVLELVSQINCQRVTKVSRVVVLKYFLCVCDDVGSFFH